MKALVTGATGFIGFHVTRILKNKSFEVRALVREGSNTSDLEALDVELVTGDIRDFESVCRALKGCQQVYHLAADYRLWVPDPETMYETNVRGTINVMQAALKIGIEKVIYTSTVGVLGSAVKKKPANEKTPSRLKDMVGHYKKSKFIAEREVSRFVQKGLPAVIVNPSTPVGPMDRKPTPTGKIIVDFLNRKLPAYLDTGLNFVDVEFDFSNYFLFLENLNVDDEELNKEVNRIGFILKNFKDLGIFSVWKLNLVRGLDYYDGLVFETFIEGSSVGAVFSGGRYNSLVKVFLGKEIPAFGGSIGIERVIDVLKEKGISKKILKKYGERYFIAYLDLDFSEYLKIADVLRSKGYKVFVYPKKDKLKKQLSYASSYNFKYAVFYGKSEKDKGMIKIKDMETGEEFFEKIR